MSTTESLKVQIDALRIEKQQVEVENVRFREKHPEQGALIDKEEKCTHLRVERDCHRNKSAKVGEQMSCCGDRAV